MSVIWDISSRPAPRKGAFGTAHGALVSTALLSFAVLGRRHDESYIKRAMVAAYSATALAPSTLWAS